jgi:uncharacterized membrane protein YgaE (UPF0421/DUF939 family)
MTPQFSDWLIGIGLGLIIMIIILSIPSFVTMIKFGRKKYFSQIKLLWKLKNKIKNCYQVETTINYTYNGVIVKSGIECKTFIPIIENGDKIWMIENLYGISIKITEHKQHQNKWETISHDIMNYPSCIILLQQCSNFKSQIKKISQNPIRLKDLDELNKLLNSEITSINRDNKIKSLFDE